MFSADSGSRSPTESVTVSRTGLRRENTVAFEQLSEPNAFRRLPVTVRPVMSVFASPPARIRFRIARQSRAGFWALSRAATPVTWGVAMDVPSKVA